MKDNIYSSDRQDHAPLSSKFNSFYRPRLFWIVVPSFIFFLTMFITVPIAVQVLVASVCTSLGEADCNCSNVSSRSSLINLYVSLGSNVPAFLLSGLYGSIADKYGRKYCILAPLFGYSCYTIILLYIQVYRPTFYVELFICGGLILGCTGSFAVFQMATFSYAADITDLSREKRGVLYSLLESCLFIAKIVGPLFAGLWAEAYGFEFPLAFGVCLCFFGMLWVSIMPESLSLQSESRNQSISFDPFKTLRNLYLITMEGGLSSPIPYLSLAFFLYFSSYMGSQQISLLYIKHQFQWGPRLIGYYDCAEGFVQTMSMILVPWLITKVFRVYVDKWWLFLGYLIRAIHFYLYGTATSTTFIFAIIPLLAFCGPLTPRTRSIISNATTSQMQASVLSAFSALQSLSSFAAPGFSAGYSVTVYYCPGCIYYVFTLLCVASSLALAFIIFRNLLADVEKKNAEYEALRASDEAQLQVESNEMGGKVDNFDVQHGAVFGGNGSGVDGFDSMSNIPPIHHTSRSNSRTFSLDRFSDDLTRRLLLDN